MVKSLDVDSICVSGSLLEELENCVVDLVPEASHELLEVDRAFLLGIERFEELFQVVEI